MVEVIFNSIGFALWILLIGEGGPWHFRNHISCIIMSETAARFPKLSIDGIFSFITAFGLAFTANQGNKRGREGQKEQSCHPQSVCCGTQSPVDLSDVFA